MISSKGKQAIALLQQGLIFLGLLQETKIGNNWGNYGDSTASAVRILQEAANIRNTALPNYNPKDCNPTISNVTHECNQPANGEVFGAATYRVFVKALQAQAEDKDWRTAVANK